MSLKDWIDDEILMITGGQQAVCRLVRPVHGQGPGEWDEPVLKRIILVRGDQSITHPRPRNVVDPGRMGCEKLRGPRCEPVRQPLIVRWRRVDLPPHEEKH